MGLVTGLTQRLGVPHETDAWIELRYPSYLRLEDARRKKLGAIAEARKALAGVDLSAIRSEIAAAKIAGATPVPADLLAPYDVHTLLRGGIVAWSYPVKVTPETIDELDEATALWAARELVRMATPTADAVKEPASLSTGS